MSLLILLYKKQKNKILCVWFVCVWVCLCGQVCTVCVYVHTKAMQMQAVPWASFIILQQQPVDVPAGLSCLPLAAAFFPPQQ